MESLIDWEGIRLLLGCIQILSFVLVLNGRWPKSITHITVLQLVHISY